MGTCESRNAGTRNRTWKGSSQEIFLLSCASIQIQAACLLHLQIPIAHCLPPAPQDACCTSKNTSDTLSQCLHLYIQLASCTSSWTYCEPADSTMLPGQEEKMFYCIVDFSEATCSKLGEIQSNSRGIWRRRRQAVSGGEGGKQYLEVQEARWAIMRCRRQTMGVWRCRRKL